MTLYLFTSHLASTVKGQNPLQAMSDKTFPNSPMMKFEPMTFGFKQWSYIVPSTLCELTTRPCNGLIGLMEASLMASRKKMKIKKKESRMSFELSLSHGALKTNALTSDFPPSAYPKFLAFFQFYKSSPSCVCVVVQRWRENRREKCPTLTLLFSLDILLCCILKFTDSNTGLKFKLWNQN